MSLERLSFAAPGLFEGCVACPRPNEPGPLYLSADGNFSLFRFEKADKGYQSRNSEHKGLYFLEDSSHEINDSMTENPGLCSNFTATDLGSSANRQNIKDEKGIFGLFCARHEVPLSFIDMFTGERYGFNSHDCYNI